MFAPTAVDSPHVMGCERSKAASSRIGLHAGTWQDVDVATVIMSGLRILFEASRSVKHTERHDWMYGRLSQ